MQITKDDIANVAATIKKWRDDDARADLPSLLRFWAQLYSPPENRAGAVAVRETLKRRAAVAERLALEWGDDLEYAMYLAGEQLEPNDLIRRFQQIAKIEDAVTMFARFAMAARDACKNLKDIETRGAPRGPLETVHIAMLREIYEHVTGKPSTYVRQGDNGFKNIAGSYHGEFVDFVAAATAQLTGGTFPQTAFAAWASYWQRGQSSSSIIALWRERRWW